MATRSMPFWPRPATTSGSSWPGSGLCAPFSGRLSWSGITRAAPPPHPPERPNSLFHRRLAYLPPYSPELQPAEHLWPVLDEPLANQYFATLADLEHVVTERCRVLNHDQLKPGTNFHWWPKPDIPA